MGQRLKEVAELTKKVLEKYPDQSLGIIERYISHKICVFLEEPLSENLQTYLIHVEGSLISEEIVTFVGVELEKKFPQKK